MTHLNLLFSKGWKSEKEGEGNETHRSIPIPTGASWFWKLLAFSGPGYLVAVGYMDPGNWATDLSGGSSFGYALLFVVLLSSVMAMFLQYLAAKLGVATGRDLAELSRARYPKALSIILWLAAEVMIIACDLAEVLGSAIALNLLFGLPLVAGVLLTALDVFLLLLLQNKGFRWLEAVVMVLIATIAVCFGFEIILSQPQWAPLLSGFIPHASLIVNPSMLYLSLGIIGATVMPHNLFLHSSIVQTRGYEETPAGKREAVRFLTIDSTIALTIAFFVNAAILVLAAAVFHAAGILGVVDIAQAYHLLTPLLGGSASVIFALGLLASGQNSTLTGTMAGQIIMEGFLNLRIPPWLRRVATRSLAIVPALMVIIFWSSWGVGNLLVFSQVILSVELPFVVVPLVLFTGSQAVMGEFANRSLVAALAWLLAAMLVALNFWLIVEALVR